MGADRPFGANLLRKNQTKIQMVSDAQTFGNSTDRDPCGSCGDIHFIKPIYGVGLRARTQ